MCISCMQQAEIIQKKDDEILKLQQALAKTEKMWREERDKNKTIAGLYYFEESVF